MSKPSPCIRSVLVAAHSRPPVKHGSQFLIAAHGAVPLRVRATYRALYARAFVTITSTDHLRAFDVLYYTVCDTPSFCASCGKVGIVCAIERVKFKSADETARFAVQNSFSLYLSTAT
jgi:hypothetical protein